MPPPDDSTRSGDLCPACGTELPARGGPCPGCAATVYDPDLTIVDDPDLTIVDGPGDGPGPAASFTGPKRIAHYRILRELGAGGMGTVFEAHDEDMDRRVALKVLSRHQASSEKSGQRFAREAWIAGKLNHPTLVKVYERGEWEELNYYSMELVRGGSLSDVLGNMKRWGRDDRLGIEFGSAEYVSWAIRTTIDAARGLDYAHREGVVHRDIKPMNLLLSRETGSVKIADFGLAFDQDATRMTTAGKTMGTLAFMSPEQILGRQDEIDARSDVYSLGVTLFQLLTLSLPFKGETQQLYMNAVLTAVARRPSKLNTRVGHDLEVVIGKALEKNPQDRYDSAGNFADDLENVLHFRPIRAQPPGRIERITKWVHRKPIHAALIAVILVALPTIAFLANRAVEQRHLAREKRIEELVQEVRSDWQHKRHGEVIASASEVLQLDPEHENALQSRSMSYVTLAEEARVRGNEKEATDLGRAALEDISRLIALNPESAWPFRLKAFTLKSLGRPEEAAEAEAIARGFGTAAPTYNDFFIDGELAWQSGDYDEAAKLYGKATVMRPQDLGARRMRALALQQSGRLQEAILDYRITIGVNPDDHVSLINLGILLTQEGVLEEGNEHLLRAGRLQPESPFAFQALADNALERGRAAAALGELESAGRFFEQAERDARRAVDLAPDEPNSHLNLGASLLERNRLLPAPDATLIEEAVGHYDRTRELLRREPGGESSGDYAAALVNTCDALIQAGTLEPAVGVCTEATEAMPGEAVGFYNLAGAHALLGHADEALAALEKDLALGDHDWQYLETDAWFESLRGDARFRDLLSRMKRAASES